MRSGVILTLIFSAVLQNCGARESDAVFWRNEREIIELSQRLKLLEYRLGLSKPVKAEQLHALKTTLSENEERLSTLRSERTSLSADIQSLKSRNEELSRAAIRQKRVRALGMEFEELSSSDGRTFKNVTITKVDDAGVNFRHEHGTARLRFAELPDERRVFFGLQESTALAALDRERSEALAYERHMEMRLAAIQEREELAEAMDAPEKFPIPASSMLQSSFPQLQTGKLAEPSRPFGSGSVYRRYDYSPYRSHRPVYRYVYRYPYVSSAVCPTSRMSSGSCGFTSRSIPSAPSTP